MKHLTNFLAALVAVAALASSVPAEECPLFPVPQTVDGSELSMDAGENGDRRFFRRFVSEGADVCSVRGGQTASTH